MNDQELDDLLRAANPISLEAARAITAPDPALRDGIRSRTGPPEETFEPVLELVTGRTRGPAGRWRTVIAAAAAVVVVAGVAAWTARSDPGAQTPSSPVPVTGSATVEPSDEATAETVSPARETAGSDGPATRTTDPVSVPGGTVGVAGGSLALPEWQDLVTPLVRTDFSDDRAWKKVCSEASAPVFDDPAATEEEPFYAMLDCVDDKRYQGLTVEDVVRLAPTSPDLTFIFLVDGKTLTDPEHPIVVVDLLDTPGRTFRVIPHEMWGVQNNLVLFNMDFVDFADSVDPDGVFRGFDDAPG